MDRSSLNSDTASSRTQPHPDSNDRSEEAELLRRLRDNDESAYRELVESYGGRMLSVARRLLGEEHEAQDAVQEAFMQAFRNLDRFDERSRLGTWLHRIVVNAALMKLRKKARKQERSVEELLPSYKEDGHRQEVAPGWEHTPLEEAQDQEQKRLVHEAIAQLPKDFRDVLILRDIEELDTQQTAEQLGISSGAVKTRLHRARQALRQLLEESVSR